MLDFIIAGGVVMIPLIICSVLALAIIIERFWQLRYSKIVPEGLRESVLYDYKQRSLTKEHVSAIQKTSPLGELFSVAITNIKKERTLISSYLEDSGRRIMHNLERNLNLLGIISSIAPLLGLLGTVFGIIKIFAVINEQGVATNASSLAGGIAEALITTAAGLIIAIPSLFFYRYFQRRLDEISYRMERETSIFLESLKNEV